MDSSDMALALERHATSKLLDDAIENVATLGFRGEALPSIASVARLSIDSRPAGTDGWNRTVDNGQLVAEGPAALPPGTRIIVEQLFVKVPARRKFLRSPKAEYAACLDVVRRLAMAHPAVAEAGVVGSPVARSPKSWGLGVGEDVTWLVSGERILVSDQFHDQALIVECDPASGALGSVVARIGWTAGGLSAPHGCAQSPDGRWLAITNYGDGACRFFDLTDPAASGAADPA